MARAYRDEIRLILKAAKMPIEVYYTTALEGDGYEYLFWEEGNHDSALARIDSGDKALGFARGLIAGRLMGVQECTQIMVEEAQHATSNLS